MIRQITIKPVLNGFVCDIGCQTVVFETPAALANAIEEYFIKPDEVEKRYREKALNRALLTDAPPPWQVATPQTYTYTVPSAMSSGSPVPPAVPPSP